MDNLQIQIEESVIKLRRVWEWLKTLPSSALPFQCFAKWTEQTALFQVLDATSELISARSAAWNSVLSTLKATSLVNGRPNTVYFGNQELDFSIARHLSLVSYMTTTWAIYDRLSNICGRLCATSKVKNNPKINPKIIEDFINYPNEHGFSIGFIIKHSYAWPLRVSYGIRNWLVHEGFDRDNTALFRSNFIYDGLNLNEEAVSRIEKDNGYSIDDRNISSCCLTVDNDPWHTHDLKNILPIYHNEIDTMFAGLTKWCIDSFIEQIKVFTARDRGTQP